MSGLTFGSECYINGYVCIPYFVSLSSGKKDFGILCLLSDTSVKKAALSVTQYMRAPYGQITGDTITFTPKKSPLSVDHSSLRIYLGR